MKFLLALLVLFYASSVVAAGVVVAYAGNVTLVDADEYKYRATAIWGWDYPLVLSGASFVAIKADVAQNSADLDVVFGAVWVGANVAPSAYICYFDVAAKWQNTSTGNTASVTAALALLASSWFSIDEIDANGNVAQTIYLKELGWVIESSNLGFGGLRYITFVGSQLLPLTSLKVYITYVQSDVVGVLNVVGDPIITPRQVETILDIENFPYKSASNRLRLNFAIGALAGTASVDASSSNYVTGTGATATYFALKKVAAVNGNVAGVEVSEFVVAEAGAASLQSTDLQTQVNAKWGGLAVFKLVSVTTTTPGASSVIYDPALGSGPLPTASSASTMAFSALLLALLLIVANLM